jgi:hypothetical protein
VESGADFNSEGLSNGRSGDVGGDMDFDDCGNDFLGDDDRNVDDDDVWDDELSSDQKLLVLRQAVCECSQLLVTYAVPRSRLLASLRHRSKYNSNLSRVLFGTYVPCSSYAGE